MYKLFFDVTQTSNVMIKQPLLKAFLTIFSMALLATSLQAKPMKVFILAGQSNMEGHAAVRTFPHIGMDPKTAPLLESMVDKKGEPIVLDDVYISFLTGAKDQNEKLYEGQLTAGFGSKGREPKVGPEFTFGIYLAKHLKEPFLIIKTAWGGKSLHTDFLSPSGAKESEGKESGLFYNLMIKHVNHVLQDPKAVHPAYDPKAGYEISGFVWFQGWNDMVDGSHYPKRYEKGGYDLYSTLMAHFIRDVRKDLNAPKMNFIIGVMGAGGPTDAYKSPRYKGVHQYFRNAMAAPSKLPEFQNNVKAVLTENYWDAQLAELDERMNAKVKNALRKAQKEGALKGLKGKELRKANDAMAEKLKKQHFTEEELKALTTGKSNAGFHYLGSSKVLCQIGRAFADAMAEFQK